MTHEPLREREQLPELRKFATKLSVYTLIAIVVCNLLPIALLLGAALLQKVVTGQMPQGGGFTASRQFPQVDPQLWATWIPVAFFVLWVIITVPLPLTGHRFGRGFMFLVGNLLLITSVMRVAGFVGSERVVGWGAEYTFAVTFFAMGALLLRVLLGLLRLLPRSWRVEERSPQTAETLRAAETVQIVETPHVVPHWSEQEPLGQDPRVTRNFQQKLRRSERSDQASSCMIVLITLLAAIILVLLVTWGISKAHWAMVGMVIGTGLIVLFGFVMFVAFTVSVLSAGSAKRIFKRQEKLERKE